MSDEHGDGELEETTGTPRTTWMKTT